MASRISVFISSPDTQSERTYESTLTIGELKVRHATFRHCCPYRVWLSELHPQEQARLYHWYSRRLPVLDDQRLRSRPIWTA